MTAALLILALAAHLAAAACWLLAPRRTERDLDSWAWRLLLAGLSLVALLIAWRWLEAGRAPFRTRYESLLLFALCAGAALLPLRRGRRSTALLSGLASLGIALLLGYALLRRDLEVIHLPPALQSPWFIPHVVVYFAGYGALLVAAMGGLLVLAGEERTSPETVTEAAALTGRCLRSGFILISVGIVLGAIWAKAAWGDYWAWDPKENQALVCWLVYAAWFHARRLRGWTDWHTAWLAAVGFALILFGYLGLHLFPTAEMSAHVYQ